MWVGMNTPSFFRVATVTDFWRELAKLAYPTLSFHNGWEDRNVDALVNTADDLSIRLIKVLSTLVQ